MADAPGATLSRRNLPRSTQACQRCRLKKAKCNQQQPCTNCTKYGQECTYALRRRTARESSSRNGTSSAHVGVSPTLPSPWSGRDESVQHMSREKSTPSERLCKCLSMSLERISPFCMLLITAPSCRQHRRCGRREPTHQWDRVLWHLIQLRAS